MPKNEGAQKHKTSKNGFFRILRTKYIYKISLIFRKCLQKQSLLTAVN